MIQSLYFLQAKCGDAARIEFQGNDGIIHNIFIDSGFRDTFKHVLREMLEEASEVDLWIISHIHDDHIGGITALLDAIDIKLLNDNVKNWWYNSPRPVINSPNNIKSIVQGDRLYNYLSQKNKLTQGDITNERTRYNLFGLEITILSPSQAGLDNLRKKYSTRAGNLFEKIEAVPQIFKGPKKTDYGIKLEDFNLGDWEQDENVDNGSSIAVLTEFNNKRVLWMADAHPKTVLDAITKLGYSKKNPLKCDWVKVTHHGSKGNNCSSLYEIINCENYLLSVNGDNIHKLPDKYTYAAILRNAKRDYHRTYNLHFTYDNETLRSILAVDGKDVYENYNFRVFYSNDRFIQIKI